jgi:hypothetical protein
VCSRRTRKVPRDTHSVQEGIVKEAKDESTIVDIPITELPPLCKHCLSRLQLEANSTNAASDRSSVSSAPIGFNPEFKLLTTASDAFGIILAFGL